MNRLERISAILVKLQSSRIITARQIADEFGISLRTVYRDIHTLEEAGIPISGNTGIGYSLVDGFKLPPLMFTREEATAFLTAEKFIEKMTDTQNAMHYKSGMNKVKAVLRYVEKDYLAGIEDNISIFGKNDAAASLPADITQCILKSIAEKRTVTIGYRPPDKNTSERDVEPLGCFYSHPTWYLIAYCRLRNEYRNFRIDRIKHFRLKDESFSRKHPTLPEYIEKTKFKEGVYEIVLRIKNADLKIINDYKYFHGWLGEESDGITTDIRFRIFNLDDFARWILPLMDIVEIIQPGELIAKVSALWKKLDKFITNEK